MDGSRDPCAPALLRQHLTCARTDHPKAIHSCTHDLRVVLLYNDNHHIKSQTGYEGHESDQQIAKFRQKGDGLRNVEWVLNYRCDLCELHQRQQRTCVAVTDAPRGNFDRDSAAPPTRRSSAMSVHI
jgi:hypothetical protein